MRKNIMIVFIVITVFVTFHSKYTSLIREFESDAKSKQALINEYIYLSSNFIEALTVVGNNSFHPGLSEDPHLISLIKYKSETNSYNLDAVGGTKYEKIVGNLTGAGRIPGIGANRNELNFALHCNEFYHKFYSRIPGIAWLYYTSENNFINIYPWLPSKEFAFSEELKKEVFYTLANPQHNPSRNLIWTPAYLDHAGKGLMVTLSSPIYDKETFKGVVSLDLTLDTLGKMIGSDFESFLFDDTDSIIGASRNIKLDKEIVKLSEFLESTQPDADEIKKVKNDEIQLIGKHFIYATTFNETPWRMFFMVPVWSIIGQSTLFTIPVLLICCLLFWAISEVERRKILENKLTNQTIALSQKNNELISSEARYHALVEQSSEALALVDIETNEIVEVNRRFTELFGYSLPADKPIYIRQIAVKPERETDQHYKNVLKQHFSPESAIYRHKNGIEVHVERAGTVITIRDKNYLLLSNRDITAERHRQAELMQDAEFACRVQRELLPEVSDSQFVDIRTIFHPSNIVSGDSYYMEWRNEGKMLRGFLIDITGHGLATALQTASINALLRETSNAKLTLLEQLVQIDGRAAKYFSEGSFAAILGFEFDFTDMEVRYVGAGITQFYFNGKQIESLGMLVGIIDNAKFESGAISISEGDCIYFLTDGFTDRLTEPENINFWSPNGKDFDADVAALELLAEKGNLRDDATGICFKIKK